MPIASHGQEHVDDPHEHVVDPAAGRARQRPDDAAHRQADDDRDHADEEADPSAEHDAAQFVPALQVQTEPVGRSWTWRRLPRREALQGIVRGDDRRQHRHDHEDGDQGDPQQGRPIAQQSFQGVAPQPAAGASFDAGDRRGSGHLMNTGSVG